MDRVPTWILVWAIAQTALFVLFLILRSIKRGSTIISNPGNLPGRGPDMQVEVDYMERFPEARFEQ